jgi:hypothetical protein
LSMKDDSAPQAPRTEARWSSEKKVEIIQRDERVNESTMKGNITFS